MTKRLSFLTALFGLAVISASASADTLAWWRFNDGVAGENVVHNGANGVYASDVLDVSGNGNDLSVWQTGDGGGYAYRSEVSSEYIPGAGKNALSVKNTGGGPAMWCSAEALQTLQPAAWTIEVAFKLENNGFKTFVGRDGDDVNGSNGAMVYFQVVGANQLAIKFKDVSGYSHEIVTAEPAEVFNGYDWATDPDGTEAQWYCAVATCDGTWLRLYGMNIETDSAFRLLGEKDITLSGSPDTALNNGTSGSTTDGGDWDPGDWTVGRGLWDGGHGDRAYGYIDEVRISDVALTPAEFMYSGGATGVSEQQSSDLVNGDVDVTLSWTPADNASITDEYVFVADATDPNTVFYYYGTAPAAGSFGPFNLNFDSSYKVCVVEAVAGSEQSFTAGVSTIDEVNEANITSIVYSFVTLPSVPVITADPADLLAEMDGVAEFTVAYSSVTAATVQWYKSTDDQNNTPDDTAVGTGADTLVLNAVSGADEGFYYAVISNESGVDAACAPAYLEVKRLVSHYSFDGAETAVVTDLMGNANGTIANDIDPNNATLSYEATETGYAASFDASGSFVSTPRMVQNSMTIEAWVKTTATGAGDWWAGRGILDGEMPNDVLDFGTALAHGDKFVYGVGHGGQLASTSAINDGQWHYCVATRDSFTGDCAVYVDGVLEASATYNTDPLTVPETLDIGSIHNGGNNFIGLIDDVKVYNYPLAELTVAKAYNDATGESVCVTSLKPEAAFDFNDDCVVGLADFVVFANQWLDCGLYPDCK